MSDATSMELARKKQIDQAITKFMKNTYLPLRIKMQVGEVGRQRGQEQFQVQKRKNLRSSKR